MASFTEKIRILLEVDSADGIGSFKKFKTSVGEAEGPLGKLKAAGTGAFDAIKANAGAMALGAGAAVAAFAAKGVMDFQNLGIEVGKFSDATGASKEDASRLIEVAGDLGVEAGTLEAAIGRMNKTAGGSPEKFAALGVEVSKTKDGLVDSNGTFLNAIDRLNGIKDPAEKARVGAELFGKGWQGMAELIGRGAPQLRTDLAAVSDAKVFDEKKVGEARDLRAAFDDIADAAQDLLLTIGSALAPVIAEIAPLLGDIIEEAGPLVELIGQGLVLSFKLLEPEIKLVIAVLGPLMDAVGWVSDKVKEFTEFLGLTDKPLDSIATKAVAMAKAADEAEQSTGDLNATVEDGSARQEYYESRVSASNDSLLAHQQAAQKARDRQNELKDAVDRGKDALALYRGELDALTGSLTNEQAFLNLQQQIDDTKTKIEGLWSAEAEGTITHEESTRQQRLAWIDLGLEAEAYGTKIGLIPKDITTLVNLANNGQIDEYERMLTVLTRNRTMNLSIEANGGTGYDVRITPSGQAPKRARGGPVQQDGTYLIGEEGPELVTFGADGMVTPNDKIGMGGGGVVYVNLTMNNTTSADPSAVTAALLQFCRTGGAAQVRRALGLN